jgi:transposase
VVEVGIDERVEALAATNHKLVQEREEYRRLYLEALEQIRRLELGLLGQKSERLPPDERQLTLELLGLILERAENLPPEDSDEDSQEEPEADPPKKRKGRKTLPRVRIEIIPLEVQHLGLDAFHRIGEDCCEQVENRPASKVVVRVVKPKFVRKDRSDEEKAEGKTKVFVADSPELPIPRSNAGPGMLADSIVKRWQDHLPAHRLEAIYAREGLELSRSTICGWHQQLSDLVRPLVGAMFDDALKQPYLLTDATGVLVQAKEKCKRGHFWVLIAPERHVLFRYSRRHDSKAVDRLLPNYKGYLVADAHSVYDHLYAGGDVIEVSCWAHCRRYFYKALGSDPARARKGLAFIKALFEIEQKHRRVPPNKKKKVRQKKSKPIVDDFFAWCAAEAPALIDDTPIQRAMGYATNQRQGLSCYLTDGRLPICNNASERELRRQAVGRKNWIFVGSADGAEANAHFTSLLASCQLHGLEPWRYLLDLFCLLPSWPINRVLELAPARWKETLENEETQRKLDANIYRRVALGMELEHQIVG